MLDRLTTQREDANAAHSVAARASEPGVTCSPFQAEAWLAAYRGGFREFENHTLTLEIDAAWLELPLTIRRLGPFRVADVTGGKHASLHAARWRGEPDHATLIAGLRLEAQQLGLDAVLITDSPVRLDGVTNPLLALAHRPSPSYAAELAITHGAEEMLLALLDRDDRKKLRQKEKKLVEGFGPIRAGFAETEADRQAALASLAAWKALRFGAQGIADPFASDEAQRFLAAATAGNHPAIRLFTLHAGERLIAVMAGAVSAMRFSGMANANDPDPVILKSSPGDLLLAALVPHLAKAGFAYFDLGVGEARYKSRWCPEPLPMVDCALAVSRKGRLAVPLFFALRGAKRAIKQSPLAMRALQKLRALRSR